MDTRLPMDQHVDILAIGFQPNDVEIGVGGILLKMAHRGYTTVICDLLYAGLNQGETLEELSKQAEKASNILHVSDRINLNLGESHFDLSMNQAGELVKCLKHYRPDIILAPYWEDWNLDHSLANQLIQKAILLAKSKGTDKTSKSSKSSWVFYYPFSKPIIPQAIVNITSTFAGKIEAVKAYQSRFKERPPLAPPSSISYRDSVFHIESRARHFGSFINCRFGEALILERPVPIEDICEFINL